MLSRYGLQRMNTFNWWLTRTVCGNPRFKSDSCESCPTDGKKKELMDIACKVAIITGGATGIGLACAQHLLCNGLHKAVIAGVNKCEGDEAVKMLNSEFGKDKAIFYKVDVNCNKQFEDLFKDVLARFQRIDILVNNAGMLNDRHWELEVETNFKGVIRGTILAFRYMAKNGSCHKGDGGVVINMSSILGLSVLPQIPVYTSTKHGVIGITKSFGDNYHFCNTNLRVTAMCPGATGTVLLNEAADKQLCDKWGQDAMKALKGLQQQPTGDCGKACVHIVKYAGSGSIWIIEGSRLYRADIPERQTYSKLVESYI